MPAAAANIPPRASLLLPRRIYELTAKATAALTLPAGKTDVIFFDDEISGFGYRLRKGAGGKVLRSWVCQYRHGGSSRRLLFGAATVLGAEQARTMAKKALGRVANGEDPQAHKLDRRGKDKHTLKATVADFLAIKQRAVRARTYSDLTRYLTDKRYFGELSPTLGDGRGQAAAA